MNSWLESNTEPHVENGTFDQNQVDFSTVVSKEGVMTQTSRKSHTSSNAPENLTPHTEAADARGRNDTSRKTNFTVSPVAPDVATALTSQSITTGEFVPVMFSACMSHPGKQSFCVSLFPILSPSVHLRVLGCGSDLQLRLCLWHAVIQ